MDGLSRHDELGKLIPLKVVGPDVKFFRLLCGVERVTSSRLGQSDDVVFDLLSLHHQIFDGRFRCEPTNKDH
ncbi:hypothetical protein NECAME_06759 [Necator americanus]|uniref:Uncharacterized protein n=1 Tax=Necator americanus TaxID=51031 RepID=W2TRH6_NECAM|nr:hypothetical protein NECAME_06759 [Necator americanus]ETN84660.1 hypothetical protein NECAME_06759 [Necator americanus]